MTSSLNPTRCPEGWGLESRDDVWKVLVPGAHGNLIWTTEGWLEWTYTGMMPPRVVRFISFIGMAPLPADWEAWVTKMYDFMEWEKRPAMDPALTPPVSDAPKTGIVAPYDQDWARWINAEWRDMIERIKAIEDALLVRGGIEPAASGEPEREAVLPEGWLLQQASTKDWMIRIPGDDTPFYYDRSRRMWQNGSIHVRRVACWLDMFPWTSNRDEMVHRINAFIAAGGMDPHARIASVTFTTDRAGAEAAR